MANLIHDNSPMQCRKTSICNQIRVCTHLYQCFQLLDGIKPKTIAMAYRFGYCI